MFDVVVDRRVYPLRTGGPMIEHVEQCRCLMEQGVAFVEVTLVATRGSTPQDVGSKMIVTSHGLAHGTVGGGRVEHRVIEQAIAMLATSEPTRLVRWNLNTDLGMTCGGLVEIFFQAHLPESWPIVIFGAGHVAQALTRVLVTLPCQVTCIDSRASWLARLPDGVTGRLHETPPELVATLPDRAYVICMTQGHRTDLPILVKVLTQSRVFPFVGVIGSRGKAAALRRELLESGLREDQISFHCPIGLLNDGQRIGTNHTGEIAISISAQLISVRDRIRCSLNT